ncbi:MAG: hypothetical protein VXA26_10720, partial [Candidatus Neomarinimicrobiota bacterium]
IKIVSNKSSFAGLNSDGTVITWGNVQGGDYTYSSGTVTALTCVSSQCSGGLTNVEEIFPIEKSGFLAKTQNGSVYYWGLNTGNPLYNNNPDSEYGNSPIDGYLGDVTQIISSLNYSFVAIQSDGTIKVWGQSSYGGNPDYSNSNIASSTVDLTTVSNISKVLPSIFYDNNYLFTSYAGASYAALRDDGTVITWGNLFSGGDYSFSDSNISSASETLTNIIDIYSANQEINDGYSAFAAVKNDKTLITWGSKIGGGDPSYSESSVESATIDNIKFSKIYRGSRYGGFIGVVATSEPETFSIDHPDSIISYQDGAVSVNATFAYAQTESPTLLYIDSGGNTSLTMDLLAGTTDRKSWVYDVNFSGPDEHKFLNIGSSSLTITFDSMAPEIYSLEVNDDRTAVDVVFTEDLFAEYISNTATGTVNASDFSLTLSSTTASLTTDIPISISVTNTSLTDGKKYTLYFDTNGFFDIGDALTVGVSSHTFDIAGNPVSSSQTTDTTSSLLSSDVCWVLADTPTIELSLVGECG